MMTERQNDQKVRFQLDLTAHQAERFDQLMRSCELGSRKELFNVAMSLFNWSVQESRKGRKIASYDPERDHIETVLLPALESVTREAASANNSTAERSAPSHADRRGFAVVSAN